LINILQLVAMNNRAEINHAIGITILSAFGTTFFSLGSNPMRLTLGLANLIYKMLI
jgi:hypothetical protein